MCHTWSDRSGVVCSVVGSLLHGCLIIWPLTCSLDNTAISMLFAFSSSYYYVLCSIASRVRCILLAAMFSCHALTVPVRLLLLVYQRTMHFALCMGAPYSGCSLCVLQVHLLFLCCIQWLPAFLTSTMPVPWMSYVLIVPPGFSAPRPFNVVLKGLLCCLSGGCRPNPCCLC